MMRKRTSDRRVSGQGKRPSGSLTPHRVELHRQLLEQFYEDSVGRYGFDNEQVRRLSRLLVPSDPPRAHKASS